jgi:NTE family protein
VLRLARRSAPDEAHPGGIFDFSPATLADRWEAGARGMREALRRFGAAPLAEGLAVHEVDV